MEKLRPDQLKKIWAMAKDKCLSEADLRSLVKDCTGSLSISGLSPSQADTVIRKLNSTRTKPVPNKDIVAKFRRTIQKRSYAQTQKAKELIAGINKTGAYALDLDEYSKRQYQKPWDLLSRKQASGVIQGLLAIQNRCKV